ncbi:MAG TPA: M14 metallopeptidase family protein [Ferruginibacter sp.]|nr:M14 metallopeptidase family protein [Ferruginibacter sp.]
MNKKIYLFPLFFLLSFILQSQVLKTPDEFLGYTLGDRFTPHYRIVAYFEYAATTMPQKMRLEKYGETYEGRPLLLAVISSPAIMERIEEVKKNNLRMAGLQNGQVTGSAAIPIVWLSYNVHGNEASSSEVSMKTLYALLSNDNVQTKEWLKNTVVIIDPCLNPDGRDRYVNWYNQVVGKNSNPNDIAREHYEPWPGGRTNHYNFDLNRDWSWQTQVETIGRIKKYNEWMPQVHVDFHEQGTNNPYFFAPAAEPFHEVITPWQRDFQVTIGKNHAKYFDEKGWLFFTKERFDLFYPSYGDTYPLYNGSIGMTYEQAGHGRAGLAIETGNDDTLFLRDRIAHHLTTSLSTIETASLHAEPLISAFKKYFEDGVKGLVGSYKTYIVSGADENKLAGLKLLFKNNQIQFANAVNGRQVKAYNYFNGRDENYTTSSKDLVISSAQPKASLVKVLFEPVSKLSDSATYDITAWALPYAFGVQSYATVEPVPGVQAPLKNENYILNGQAYGYLINYTSFEDGKLLAALLKNKIKVRVADKDFVYNGVKFKPGTLVVLRKGNENNMQKFFALAKQFNNIISSVSTGFMETGFDLGSDKFRLLKTPEIVLLTGRETSEGAAGEVWHLFDQQIDYPITLVNAENFSFARNDADVLIIPDGNYRFLNDKDQITALKSWVRQGGKIIVMENAVSQLSKMDIGIQVKKEDEKNIYKNIRKYGDREKEEITNNIPGAIYKIELDNTHPLAFGYPSYYFSLKLNTGIYDFSKEGWNVGVIKKEKQVSGFVGSRIKEKIADGTVIGVIPMGRGAVIYFADDPLFRSFWESGKLLMLNAVFIAD